MDRSAKGREIGLGKVAVGGAYNGKFCVDLAKPIFGALCYAFFATQQKHGDLLTGA